MVRRTLLPAALAALAAPAFAAPPVAGPVLGGDASACTSGEGPAILATITGLKDRAGELKLELYPGDAEDFLKDDRDLVAQGKFFRRVRITTPSSGPVSICIRAPHAGQYALLFSHNRDGKNKFDYKIDGAGVPSNKRMGYSKPGLQSALVTVGPGVTAVHIKAQYVSLFGFSPSSGP